MSDLANIHIETLKYINDKSKSLILNCGYGKGYSVLDIVKILTKINDILSTKKKWGYSTSLC